MAPASGFAFDLTRSEGRANAWLMRMHWRNPVRKVRLAVITAKVGTHAGRRAYR